MVNENPKNKTTLFWFALVVAGGGGGARGAAGRAGALCLWVDLRFPMWKAPGLSAAPFEPHCSAVLVGALRLWDDSYFSMWNEPEPPHFLSALHC